MGHRTHISDQNRAKREGISALALKGAEAVPELVDKLIRTAVEVRASDLHLEPKANELKVRLRLDGVMHDFCALEGDLQPNVVARCKVMAGLLTYRTDLPQEGAVAGGKYGDNLGLRVSTFPTNHGERVAIRLFDPEAKRMRLEELGFAADVLRDLQTSLAGPEGLIFLSGPSGSGKTTTLYACLEYISREFQGGRNIVSVEDPVEVDMPGVTQTAVKRAVGLDFAQSLRSLLRQDPEVIMVGEVRDPETARIAVEAGLTGHLVLSTVHASRAALVPHRLLDMGVEPYALAGALKLAISQRLLRRVCPRCGGSTAPRNNQGGEKVNLDNTEECSVCHGTGYSGRILLTEELKATETLHEAIMNSASRTRFQGLSQGGLEEDAKRLLAEGKTTKFEVRRVLGEVEL